MAKPEIYTTGGTVQAGNGVYIPRKADEQLLAFCQSGDFAFVLTPRQMGKSSLMVSTAERLAKEDVRSVIIDLSLMGTKLSSEAWYLGLLDKIQETLALKTDVFKWWTEHDHLGVTQRLIEFLEKILLVEVEDRVVIFVDEIDTTLSLDFTDDFYAAIRYLYNARSISPRFKRLSFVLIGVAAPGDLIRDERRTPFNIGKRVNLTDFTKEEALPLADGLGLPAQEAQAALARMMSWTKGHPYLTQKLCKALVEKSQPGWKDADVDKLVISTFFSADSSQDNNLQFVRDMLTKRAPDMREVLGLYRKIRSGRKRILDEEQSIIKNHLKLSGVVCRERSDERSKLRRRPLSGQAVLRTRNPIYRKAFNGAFVNEHMPMSWFARARKSGLVVAVVLLILSFGLSAVWIGRTKGERDRLKADNSRFQVEREELISQNLSQRGNLADPYAGFQIVGQRDDSATGDNSTNKGSLKARQLKSDTIYASTDTGSVAYTLYEDLSIVLTRVAPEGGAINTWLPKPPKKVQDAPGKLPDKQSSSDSKAPREFATTPFVLGTIGLPTMSAEAATGRCIDPHPGPFRSWYGEKNDCWVAVYRQWQDGCTHYQWYNSCYNYWDTHPNGAPKVYWTACVH